MSNFKGYLLKAIKTNKIFPLKYINYGSWSSTPKQREELKAYRDDNTRDLTRVTAEGTKSVFSFTTRTNLHLDEKMEIQKFFTDAEENTDEAHLQRKVQLQYWNEETNQYETAYFYRPDLQFPILLVIDKGNDSDIIYGGLKLDFVEY